MHKPHINRQHMRSAFHRTLAGSHLLYYGAIASGWHTAHAAAATVIFVLLIAGFIAGGALRVPPGA